MALALGYAGMPLTVTAISIIVAFGIGGTTVSHNTIDCMAGNCYLCSCQNVKTCKFKNFCDTLRKLAHAA